MWSGYAGVWHLNEAGDGAVQILDSTTNALNGTAQSVSLAVTNAPLGGARRIAPDNNHAPGIVIPATSGAQKDAADRLGTDFHASFWLRSRSGTSDFSDLKWGNIIGRRKGDNGTSWGFAFHGEATDANQSKYMRVFAGSTKITTTKGTIGEYLRESASETWKKVDVVWKFASNGNSPVAVVYHNVIDKTGDTRDTEGDVFEAVELACADIEKLVQTLLQAGCAFCFSSPEQYIESVLEESYNKLIHFQISGLQINLIYHLHGCIT